MAPTDTKIRSGSNVDGRRELLFDQVMDTRTADRKGMENHVVIRRETLADQGHPNLRRAGYAGRSYRGIPEDGDPQHR